MNTTYRYLHFPGHRCNCLHVMRASWSFFFSSESFQKSFTTSVQCTQITILRDTCYYYILVININIVIIIIISITVIIVLLLHIIIIA